ncbi:hypothetical protein [Malikia spinosa]|uniref:Phospholipase n=1 Tax=Malikia spinosa TaxID=86180 RepID=A0A7C9IXQ7_9BURK|nr:hypothetical protein [Malikia spinosa]MYZ51547.1 hypothetical protein [Malikia spinosa]
MKDFGVVMQEALEAFGQGEINQARALAQMGTSAADLAQQFARGAVDMLEERNRQQLESSIDDLESGILLARKAADLGSGAVDLMLDTGRRQLEGRMGEVEAANLAARKVAAAGVVGATVTGATVMAAVNVPRYGKRQYDLAISELLQDANDQIERKFLPQRAAGQPCLPCLDESSGQARRLRIEKRQRLLLHGERSPEPTVRDAAQRLKADMHAVELARLSDNSYAQHDPKAGPKEKKPPEPWQAMTEQEIQDAGLSPKLVNDAKAVIYKLPPDFPFDPKTVVAFRGTTADTEDILTDHDQALGLETEQYKAASELGKQLRRFMPDAEVTGHSLGGGKAQAAGVAGGLKGSMFNATGLHPKTAGMFPADLATHAGRFQQYRAEGEGGGDPLTSFQNSLALQQKLYGGAQNLQKLARANQWASKELGVNDPLALLPESAQPLARGLAGRILNTTPQEALRNLAYSGGQWYVPPTLGAVRGIASKTAQGHDAPFEQQHGISGVINGLETRKAGDINKLLAGTGLPGPASDYIGPTRA